MKDYTMFTQTDGVYSYTFECEKKEDCLVCGKVRKVLEVDQKQKLSILIDKLKEGDFQMNQDCGRFCVFFNLPSASFRPIKAYIANCD